MAMGSSDTAEMDFGSGDHVNGNIDSMSATSVNYVWNKCYECER